MEDALGGLWRKTISLPETDCSMRSPPGWKRKSEAFNMANFMLACRGLAVARKRKQTTLKSFSRSFKRETNRAMSEYKRLLRKLSKL